MQAKTEQFTWLRLAWGVCVVFTLLWLIYHFSEPILGMLIPLYQRVLQWMDGRLVIEQFAVLRQHGEHFLTLQASVYTPFFIGTDYIVPDKPLQNSVSMPAGNVLLPMVVMPSLLLISPIQRWQEAAIRWLACLPALLVVLLLDIPLQFCYLIWDGVFKSLQSSGMMHSPLALWSDFLNAGGLIGLSIFAAIIVIAFSQYVTAQSLTR